MTAHNARSSTESFFATCPRNTEGLLVDELRSFGAADVRETRSGASFGGPLSLAYRACLWSRVASRVLLRLGAFPASAVDDLYEAVHGLPWEEHLRVDGTLAVEATSTIRQGPLAAVNTHFVEQRVKDAVVDRFRERTARRPAVDLARPDVRIAVHLSPAEAIVSLDLSGEGLHRRGYRIEGGEAPLRENLAAAVLLRAGWPAIAAQGGALLDPMCGSGTLLVEGALIAGDVAPGLLRDYYGFLGWLGFDPGDWHPLLDEARERRAAGLRSLPSVFGSDADARAIGAARANARRAGLAGRIDLKVADLRAVAPPVGPKSGRDVAGLVVTNPPYGKRLGESRDLVSLYETLGEALKRSFTGWEAAVFTANPELSAHLGLRARRVNVLYNGPLAAKLLLFTIGPSFAAPRSGSKLGASPAAEVAGGRLSGEPAAVEPPAVEPPLAGGPPTPRQGAVEQPVATRRSAPEQPMFANRLRKNFKHLRRWARREGVSCYRVYDADLPEYAVAVDIYDGWAHVQEYAPPSTVDPVQARRRLKEVMRVVPEILDIPDEHAILKVRSRQRGAEQYRRLQDRKAFLEVGENGLGFLVNLNDYLDTGLFLDHRPTRRLIRELAPGRRFLNLFAYTGSATVCAAAGGATSTTSVDLSRVYLEWAARNLELNGLSGPQHGFIRADCLEWLQQAAAGRAGAKGDGSQAAAWRGQSRAPSPYLKRGEPSGDPRRGNVPPGVGPVYDLIFLDAPTFSNSRSMEGTLDIQRDHPWMIRLAASLLSPEGILLFSSNFRRFKLDPALPDEFAVKDITRETIPPDFSRSPRVHTCFRIGLRGAGAGRRNGTGRDRSGDGKDRRDDR